MRIDSHTHVGFDPLYYLQGWSPYALDLPRLLRETDAADIHGLVVFPFIAYMALDPEALRRNRIVLPPGAVPYEFENRRLCRDLTAQPADVRVRCKPFLIGDPARHPAAQVQAWRALPREYRVYGLKFQTHTIQAPIQSLLEKGACMLDYAEDHNLSVTVHASVHPGDRWSQCSDILRVVEARPGLRFVLAHSCRFDRPTLERVASLDNAWFDCASLGVHCDCARLELPAVAPPARRFATDYRDPARVLHDLARTWPKKLIWGSDAPYYSIVYDRLQLQSSYAREASWLEALPEPLRDNICRRNPLAWLGLHANDF